MRLLRRAECPRASEAGDALEAQGCGALPRWRSACLDDFARLAAAKFQHHRRGSFHCVGHHVVSTAAMRL